MGDANGCWVQCVFGDVLHFWRYDMTLRRLFIAYSAAFGDMAEFARVLEAIEAV